MMLLSSYICHKDTAQGSKATFWGNFLPFTLSLWHQRAGLSTLGASDCEWTSLAIVAPDRSSHCSSRKRPSRSCCRCPSHPRSCLRQGRSCCLYQSEHPPSSLLYKSSRPHSNMSRYRPAQLSQTCEAHSQNKTEKKKGMELLKA